jgi:hypothetical protein
MKLPDKMTYGEAYDPAMKITDPDEASEYFEALVERSMRLFGKSREQAEADERSSIGYWTGYHDNETAVRVQKLFDCAHPIIGKAGDKRLSDADLLSAGAGWAAEGEK